MKIKKLFEMNLDKVIKYAENQIKTKKWIKDDYEQGRQAAWKEILKLLAKKDTDTLLKNYKKANKKADDEGYDGGFASAYYVACNQLGGLK